MRKLILVCLMLSLLGLFACSCTHTWKSEDIKALHIKGVLIQKELEDGFNTSEPVYTLWFTNCNGFALCVFSDSFIDPIELEVGANYHLHLKARESNGFYGWRITQCEKLQN